MSSADDYAAYCMSSNWGATSDSCSAYGSCMQQAEQHNYAHLPDEALSAQCYSQYVLPTLTPPTLPTPPEDDPPSGGGFSLPPINIPQRPPDVPPVDYNNHCRIASLVERRRHQDCPERYFIGNQIKHLVRDSSLCKLLWMQKHDQASLIKKV